MKQNVLLEKRMFMLAAAEGCLEECFNKKRVAERRCNNAQLLGNVAHVLLCE